MYLRNAAQGVGILDVKGIFAAGEGTALNQAPQESSALHLAWMRTGGVQTGIKSPGRAVQSLQTQAASGISHQAEILGLERGQDADGSGEGRAIGQGQALLGFQGHRRQAGPCQGLLANQPLTFIHHLAQANEGQGHVGQRRQITAGA